MRGARGGSRDNFRGGNNRNNRFQGSGGRGGSDRSKYDDGNAVKTVECGIYDGACEGLALFRLTTRDKSVPLNGSFVYDSAKNKIGTIKDVFGPLDKVCFSVELANPATALAEGARVYAPAERLKSEAFYLSDQNSRRGGKRGGRGGNRGGSRGGRGGRGGGGRGGNRGGAGGGNRGGNRGGGRGRRF